MSKRDERDCELCGRAKIWRKPLCLECKLLPSLFANRERLGLPSGVRLRKKRIRFLVDRDGAGCWLCGKMMNFQRPPDADDSATFDHVEPRCVGGKDRLSNCRLAHRRCNNLRLRWWPETMPVQYAIKQAQKDSPYDRAIAILCEQ